MKILRPLYRWHWNTRNQEWNLKLFPWSKTKATVYPNGVWHTWDRDLIGGESSQCEYHEFMDFENRHFVAKREAFKSCISQGFI